MRLITWLAGTIALCSPFYHGAGIIPSIRLGRSDTTAPGGRSIFETSCRPCHRDSSTVRAPDEAMLSQMSPRSILAALSSGKMRAQGELLTPDQRKMVAEWLTQKVVTENGFPKDAFTPFSFKPGRADYSGWGGNKASTGYRPARQSGIDTKNLLSLHLKWAFAFPDATVMRTKPAVAGDWLLVGGQYGEVLAINKFSGKLGWEFQASAAVRGAIVVVEKPGAVTAYFADFSTDTYAIDVRTGKLLWNKRAGYDQQSAVTGSVAVAGGLVLVPITSTEVSLAVNGKYPCCTSSGGVVALDASTGEQRWEHRVLPPAKPSGTKKNGQPYLGPAGAPVWCSPTIDEKRGLVYIGTGENYSTPATSTSDAIQAVDLKTGKLVWNFQSTANDTWNLACPYLTNCPSQSGPDLDFGMAPILVRRPDGEDILVVGQKSALVYGLRPASGKVIWKTRIGRGGALGGVHWGMATDGNYVYAANADNAIAADRRDTSTKIAPGIYALDLMTGKVKWKTPSPACKDKKGCIPANSAAPSVTGQLVFAGGLDGHIRAYDVKNGAILWDVDTEKDYQTVDGIPGKGGSIDGPPPVFSDGMLYVNSGYGMFGQQPGNVLLCFDTHPSK